MAKTSTTQFVRVRREALVSCMTCPLCNKLLEEATTISECLHSFCRKCIYKKLDDGEIDSCPICNTDLGCAPVEKLRDGNLPVSFIQKYLVKKLDLTSEVEVEITCRGQPVIPTLELHDLVDMWLQTTPASERVAASVGISAKDFVMVLTYARKLPIL